MSKTGKASGFATDAMSIRHAVLKKNFSRDLFLITCRNILKCPVALDYEKQIAKNFNETINREKTTKDFNYHVLATKIKLIAYELSMRSSNEHQKNY